MVMQKQTTSTVYLKSVSMAGKTLYMGVTNDGQIITLSPTPADERYTKSGMGSSFKLCMVKVPR